MSDVDVNLLALTIKKLVGEVRALDERAGRRLTEEVARVKEDLRDDMLQLATGIDGFLKADIGALKLENQQLRAEIDMLATALGDQKTVRSARMRESAADRERRPKLKPKLDPDPGLAQEAIDHTPPGPPASRPSHGDSQTP